MDYMSSEELKESMEGESEEYVVLDVRQIVVYNEYQNRIVNSIAEGVERYFNLNSTLPIS